VTSDRPNQPEPTPADVTGPAPGPTVGATHTGPSTLPPGAPAEWGEFRILRELGHGGFGRVYCAFDEGLAKEIALKIVRPSDPSRIPAVMREGQMLARVRHPNIVTVHAVRRVGDEVGFVMDLIDGESLFDWVRRVGRLGAEEAVAIGETLCHALAAVHAAGLLHRDIKARNVMRDSAGRIMLMDFGAGREEALERGDDLMGTPPYLAPELFRRRPASRASDIYSLGVLLYFLVSGAVPVEGDSANDIASAHASGTRRLLVDRRPDLPPEFIHVVERAISADPARRYQSAGELIADLHALIVRRPREASEGLQAIGPSLSPWPSRLALAGVAFLGIVLIGFLATRAYDRTFDVGRYTDASFSTWIRIGLQSMVPPVGWVAIAGALWLIVRTLWQTIRSAAPPVHRLASRVQSTVSSVVSRRALPDRLGLARWLLLGQVVVVLALSVQYWALLMALITPFNTADPAVWHVLFYSHDQTGPVNGYQALLPISAAAMGFGWWRLIRSAGGLIALDRGVVVVGLAIVGLLVVAAAVPWRVFNDARHLHRYNIDGDRCYEVGRRDNEVRVFCPDVMPGSSRARIRTEQVGKLGAQLGEGDPPLSPYAPAK